MIRSFLIKLVMVAVTLGALVWIGSATPAGRVTPHQPPPAAVPISTASRQLASPSSMGNPPVAADGSLPELPERDALWKTEEPASLAANEAPSGESLAVNPGPSRRVDLNQATLSELETLPGIGPRLAQRVIDHRNAQGPFATVEDLREVKGIGHKKFDRLRSHVQVTHPDLPSRHKGAL